MGWPVFALPPWKKYRRRDRAHLVPPNVGWMQQSPAVRRRAIFPVGSTEVLGGEKARVHHATKQGCSMRSHSSSVASRKVRSPKDLKPAGGAPFTDERSSTNQSDHMPASAKPMTRIAGLPKASSVPGRTQTAVQDLCFRARFSPGDLRIRSAWRRAACRQTALRRAS